MTEKDPNQLERLIRNVDEALARNPALTPEQFEDVKRLRAELQEACRTGRTEEAKQCEQLAIMIIREGAPASE